MPLYARTEKRLKRKEREDELGMTAVKAAMKENGELGDSDSDDEASVSGESSDGDEVDDDLDEEEMSGEDDGDEDDDDEDEDEEDEVDGPADEKASEADSETFPLSIEEIETNPIYPLEGHEGCLLCPGKFLKHAQMRDTHIASAPHKRAMKRWEARLAEVETRPFPSDDPRDVMNEILDDLEDRRTNTVPAPTETTKKTEETTKPKSDSPPKEGRKRKNRRGRSKAERKDQKAQEAVQSVEIGEGAKEVVTNGSGNGKVETKEGGKGRALNRRARRLLAKQAAGTTEGKDGKANAKDNGTKSTKTPKENKTAKEPTTTEVAVKETAPGEAGTEKKRRKRNSEAKKVVA